MGKQAKPEDLVMEMPQIQHTTCWKATYFSQRSEEGKLYCGRCYFNSEITRDLRIRSFHAFAYGVFESKTCQNCGHPVLQVRPVSQCSNCASSYIRLYREIRNMGFDTGNVRGIIFDIINSNVLYFTATDSSFQQLFPQVFELFPHF